MRSPGWWRGIISLCIFTGLAVTAGAPLALAQTALTGTSSTGSSTTTSGSSTTTSSSSTTTTMVLPTPAVPPPTSAVAPGVASVERIGGATRDQTAAMLAATAIPGPCQNVIVATDANYPDALTSSYLAGVEKAPILLTNPDSLSSATAAEIAALKAKYVTIVGGPAAVSQNVANQLMAMPSSSPAGGDLVVTRIGGADRYQTAAMVAEAGAAISQGTVNNLATAIFASGANFPDALAAGALAYADHLPLLISDPTSLSTSTANAANQLGIQSGIIVGGPAALSAEVASDLNGLSISTSRFYGGTRYGTAAQLAWLEEDEFGFTTQRVVLATGSNFPDALAAGVLAGTDKEPILLMGDPVPAGTAAVLESTPGPYSSLTVAGGTAAVSTASVDAAVSYASRNFTTPGNGPDPYPPDSSGYDISWPQCPSNSLPAQPYSIGIAGINDGLTFSANPCLASQAQWASQAGESSTISAYLNMNGPQNPPGPHDLTGPAGTCATSDGACLAYNYGWNAATYSMAQAATAGLSPRFWWLDVETYSGNPNFWFASTSQNDLVIFGAIHALQSAGDRVGIYAVSGQWQTVAAGAPVNLPQWLPAVSPDQVASECASGGFGGGVPWLTQHSAGSFDGDIAC